MRAEVVKFESEHARDIIRRNIEEGLAVGVPTVSVDDAIKAWGSSPDAHTMLIDGIPACCAGIVDIGWMRGEAWTLVSSLFYANRKVCYRAIKGYLDDAISNCRYRRIQSVISLDLESGDRWMRHLGFEKEGVLRCFGPQGEDVSMFSRVKG